MKKGRPGVLLNVICEPEKSDIARHIIFTESTTLGIRSTEFRKDTLSRKFETIHSVYGDVTVKRSFYKEKEVSCKPEYDDCRKLAAEKGIPVKEVYNSIMAELFRKKN